MINMNLSLLFLLILHLSYTTASSNIVLILADDLDLVLNGMTPLKNTVNLIGKNGETYSNCVVAAPVCCPNRASILTGRYMHNHLTINNSMEGNCNSAYWQQTHEPKTFATLLKNLMGYKTFYAGKYMNEYGHVNAGGVQHVPPGWDSWYGLVGNSVYYDYTMSINGIAKKFGHRTDDYLTDVIKNYAVQFINRQTQNQPFLMFLSPPAPHSPFIPAARHSGAYKGTKAKRTTNFNTLPQQDKHWLIRMGPSPLPDQILPKLDDVFSRRWETLLAVDELVSAVMQALTQKGFLNKTYVIFTSDNGFHVGQFSQPIDKRQPYETDIRLPFLIRGPNIPSGIERTEPISSVDIFSTILEIAGLEKPSDGTSILKDSLSKDRTLLIEYRGTGKDLHDASTCSAASDPNMALCSEEYACKCQDARNNTYSCARRISKDFNNLFCIFEDDQNYIEAYDLKKDSDQMENIGYTMKRGLRYRFRKRLKKMVKCVGAECIYNGPKDMDTNYKRVLQRKR